MLHSLLLALALAAPPTPRQAIAQVLTTQTAAWNRGDIPGFMAGYWHSDSLVFIGKKGPTYGWQPTLDNYRRSYADATQMGQLDFSQLRITPLGTEVAQVVGHWHLARPGVATGDLQGQFLLIFRKLNGQWVIVADHTSSS
ncbi:nuclear transport factor 2 family protein [Hymenobacter sp. H14-R3]|uniref:YybH family protein n=1 Tax=Hymenobacter sp. H14-R3 TaxID=3046308 RepID=UPI0024BAC968|nr:nuclear transport factor 2 family protein [Hymenobacter sp. H14-R3]MDJ0366049.1 nuclear transport factor 2 family protein [Hymenobacter sp. H14-R3]